MQLEAKSEEARAARSRQTNSAACGRGVGRPGRRRCPHWLADCPGNSGCPETCQAGPSKPRLVEDTEQRARRLEGKGGRQQGVQCLRNTGDVNQVTLRSQEARTETQARICACACACTCECLETGLHAETTFPGNATSWCTSQRYRPVSTARGSASVLAGEAETASCLVSGSVGASSPKVRFAEPRLRCAEGRQAQVLTHF